MKTFYIVLITCFSALSITSGFAQKPKKKFKTGGIVELNDSLTTFSQSDIFIFPNVNKIKRYYDANALKKIRQLETSGTQQERYEAIKNYVRNFGIENFAYDTNLLWELAKLAESEGSPGEAILLYKLVLKHHRQDIDGKQVRKEYDTLTRFQKDLFVPLDYYYELVAFRKEIDTLRPPQGVLVKMGDWVNSNKADYAPTFGNNDNILLFTSKRNAHARNLERSYDEDLFFTEKFGDAWLEAEEFKTINTHYNEGSACLSKDGKSLYFARCNSPDSYGGCDIFMAEMKADSTWGNVKNLGKNINTTGWDSHPSLSHSGDTLFFTSDRLGGFGLADIYYSERNPDGSWKPAQNIGPIINSRHNEVSPFFHHKFNVLYFSSNGHILNFGDFDIYKSYKLGTTWVEPKNIGPLVNGPGSEYYFTIDSESNQLFYARSEEEDIQDLNLHSFPVPMGAQPEAVVNLGGSLTNSHTKKPMQGIVSIIDLDKGVEVAPKFLREDGTFDFSLINKRNYLLIIQGDDFFRIEEIFFLDGDMEIHKETEPISTRIEFTSLEFENGKADILPAMHSDLGKVGNFLLDSPHLNITISGHTDSQGREEANLKLSQARADAIKEYLVEEFLIDDSRITAIGYGSSKPIVAEKTDDDRALNRRVEFEIQRKD